MEKAKKEFKELLTRILTPLNRKEKRNAIEGLMDVLKDTLKDLGVGVEIKHIDSSEDLGEEIQEMLSNFRPKGFLDFLKKISGGDFDIADKDDLTEKIVGDSVIVIGEHSAYYMHDYETKKQLSKDLEMPIENFIDQPAVVIKTGVEFMFNCGHCDRDHGSDLVIYYPHKEKKYYIASSLVKHI